MEDYLFSNGRRSGVGSHVVFFQERGYFHAKNFIDRDSCEALKKIFESDVKPVEEPMLRQRSVLYENHRFSKQGYIENALLDVHRYDVLPCDLFVKAVNNVLNDKNLVDYLDELLGADSILVQSMYFESSRGTIPHFDKFFLGVEKGDMLGVWIALEDIEPSSGRFFIYDRSHDLLFNNHPEREQLAELLEEYKALNEIAINGHQKMSKKHHVRTIIDSKKVLEKIISLSGWQKKYFTMKQGDVLFFSSSTLHGSDMPEVNHASRNSLTAHFISPQQTKIRYGGVSEPIVVDNQNGLNVHVSQRYSFQDKGLRGNL